MTRTRLAWVLALVTGAAGFAAPAVAGVFVDLRVRGQSDKRVEITHLGQVVPLDLYLTVTGANVDGADDALWGFKASFKSTNLGRGNVLGTLWAETMAPFDGPGSQDTSDATWPGSNQPAHQQDLDGDGDLDVGSDTYDGWFAARAGFMVPGRGDGLPEYHVARLTFTVTGFLSPEPGDVTEIKAFRPPRGDGGELVTGCLWQEDGIPKISEFSTGPNAGTVTTGDPVSLFLDAALAATLPALPPLLAEPEPEPAPEPPAPEPPAPEPPTPEPPTPEPPTPEPPTPEPPTPEPPTPEPPTPEPPTPEPPAPEPPTPEPPTAEPPTAEPPAPEPPGPQQRPDRPPRPPRPDPPPPDPEPEPPAPTGGDDRVTAFGDDGAASEADRPSASTDSDEPRSPTFVACSDSDSWTSSPSIPAPSPGQLILVRLPDCLLHVIGTSEKIDVVDWLTADKPGPWTRVPTVVRFLGDWPYGNLIQASRERGSYAAAVVMWNGSAWAPAGDAIISPEPATLALLAAGAGALVGLRRRRRN